MDRIIRQIIVSSFFMFVAACITVTAQTSFDLRFSQARQLYADGRYSDAVLILEASLEGVGLTDDQRAKAQSLIDRCQIAISNLSNTCVTCSLSSSPAGATVYSDGSKVGVTPCMTKLKASEHTLHIEKDGYTPLDTSIIVSKTAAELKFSLTPKYAAIKLDIKPEAGFSFSKGLSINVGGHSLDYFNESSFLKPEDDVRYFTMYQGRVILVPHGSYSLVLSADGFDSRTLQLNLIAGDHITVDETLPAKKGTIRFAGNHLSNGADIMLDGENIGTFPIEDIIVSAGTHTLSYQKEGMISSQSGYSVDVQEGDTMQVWVDMKKYKSYKFTANQEDAIVLIDGEKAGVAPLTIKMPEGEHQVMACKEGYYCGEIAITVDSGRAGDELIKLSLTPSRAIRFESDGSFGKERLSLFTTDEHIIADRTPLPCEVQIPSDIISYKAVVHTESPLIRAYKGPVRLNGDCETYRIRSFSKTYFQLVNVEIPVLSAPGSEFTSNSCELSLLKFSPIPFAGLSTSMLKASFEHNESISLSALSCLLLNWDFRLGGSISKNIDLGFLGTFTYYPDLSSLLATQLLSGEEWFAGVELSSRIPYLNVSLKTGINHFENTCFVMKFGISLGGKDSKGNCYMRF